MLQKHVIQNIVFAMKCDLVGPWEAVVKHVHICDQKGPNISISLYDYHGQKISP